MQHDLFTADLLKNERFIMARSMKLLRNRDDAEDLKQSVLLLALVNRDKFALGTNMRGWLSTMTYNLFVTRFKKSQNTDKRTVCIDDMAGLYTYAEKVPGGRNDGADALEIADVERALNTLPDKLLRPLRLQMAGHTGDEIAKIIGIPAATVRGRHYKARALLANLNPQA